MMPIDLVHVDVSPGRLHGEGARMTPPLNCEAFVIWGMGERLIAYLEGAAGQRAIASAKAMHQQRDARLKEVLKAYNLAQLYAGLCAHYRVDNLADICKLVSADAARALRHQVDQVIEQSLPRLLELRSANERSRLDHLVYAEDGMLRPRRAYRDQRRNTFERFSPSVDR